MVVLLGCHVHSAYIQLATLLNLVMSAILFLNALLCIVCASDTATHWCCCYDDIIFILRGVQHVLFCTGVLQSDDP